MMRSSMHLSAVVLGISLCAPAASAQSHEAAAAAFEEARRAIGAGDCAAALPKLDESLRNEPSVGAHISYADCFESIDPFVAFWHLRDAALIAFLRHDERHATTERRSAALLPKVAAIRLTIRLLDMAAPGLSLRIDGKSIDRFHLTGPIGVRPGDHEVSASTSDGRRWAQHVNAKIGQIAPLDVTLAPAPSVPASPPTAPVDPNTSRAEPHVPDREDVERGSSRRTLAVLVGAAGAVTLATGGAFGVLTLARRDDLDRACNGDADRCTGAPQLVDPLLASAERSATVSTILFATGAAMLAGGVVLWLTAPTSNERRYRAGDRAVLRW